MLSFRGRTVVITGGGGALGRAYALEFARRGANILLNDLGSANVDGSGVQSESAASGVVKEIVAKGGKAVADYHNVATEGDLIIEAALRAFDNRVDVVVNNAGILRDKSFHKLTRKDWKDVLDVHLEGTFSLCHAVWPHMQKAKFGRIINVGSGAGLYGNFGQANYAAAKMGILGLTSTLAKEGAKHNITANCVVPIGASRMTATVLPPAILALLQPEHVAPIVAYLAHDSTETTGGVFEVGGGWYSRVRLERSPGLALGTSEQPATAERVAEHWGELTAFPADREDCQFPTEAGDALKAMMTAATPGSASPASVPAAEGVGASVPSQAVEGLVSTQQLRALAGRLSASPELAKSVGDVVKTRTILFELVSDEKGKGATVLARWCLDGSQGGVTRVLQLPLDADAARAAVPKAAAVIRLSDDTWVKLVSGGLSTEWAYMRGQLKISGSMGVALKMKAVLGIVGTISKS